MRKWSCYDYLFLAFVLIYVACLVFFAWLTWGVASGGEALPQ